MGEERQILPYQIKVHESLDWEESNISCITIRCFQGIV